MPIDQTQPAPGRQPGESTPYGLRLHIQLNGSQHVQQKVCNQVSCVIGRSKDVEVHIPHPLVSCFHAELRATERGTFVRDFGSTNGVYLPQIQAQIQSAWVPDGSTLLLGGALVTVYRTGPLDQPPLPTDTSFGELRGQSERMRRCFAELRRIASRPLRSLLLHGETGTGKELAARAIHAQGLRAKQPFVTLDCTTLTRELSESQLFGHKKGAFSGAETNRRGAFPSAEGGTLFIDELGELPLELQAKLLRAIERGEVTPVGSDVPIRVDVHVICATWHDLRERVNAGSFRLDLYQRITPPTVYLPALAEHPEDIPALLEHFAAGVARTGNLPHLTFTQDAQQALMSRKYPGNVRELRKIVEVAATFADTPRVTHEALIKIGALSDDRYPVEEAYPHHQLKPWAKVKETCERLYLQYLLRHAETIAKASEISGIPNTRLREKLKSFALLPESPPRPE